MNMFKKMMMGALVAFAFSQNAMALSEIGGVYQIGTCQDLHDFSQHVNSGNYTANAVLKANINMADCKDGANTKAFTPIGDQSSNTSKKYKGTFDGKGFTITGIIIVGEDDQFYGGLVGYLDASGVVEDVVLYDINMSSPTGSGNFDFIGGIAGYSLGNIRNCTVAGASTIFARRTIGGIVGLAEGGTIINCLSNVKLLAYAETDGRTYAGGIVGRATNAVTIKNSVYVGSQIMRCNLNKVTACGDLNKRDECQTTCAVKEYDLVHECAIACGDEYNDPHTYPNIENCYVDGEALKSKNHTIDGAPNNTSGETVNGVTELTAAEINTDQIVCKLNGGTWNNVLNACIDGDGPWTTGESVTNHGGINLGDETYFEIVFDANGGKYADNSTQKTKNIIAHGQIEAPDANPTRIDDEFVGWGTSDISSSPATLGKATATTTFYAIWANSYLIKFDANGGKFPKNAITSKRLEKNATIDASDIPEPSVTSGLVFAGWSQNQAAKTPDGSLGNANEAKVFYAVYTGEFAVSFNSNGHGTFAQSANRTKNVSIGDAITAAGIDNPVPDVGYTFMGWSRNPAATVPDENLGMMGTSAVTIYAVWQENKVTITFDPNGGYFDNKNTTNNKKSRTKQVRIGDQINSNDISSSNPPVTKSNNKFLGWNTNKSASTAMAELGIASENKTFYAIFTTANIYTVTFHDNGHGSLPEDQRVLQTSGTVTEPTALTEKGYTFGGWFTEPECTTEFEFSSKITQNMNLYAKWTPNIHTVTINVYDNKHNLISEESESSSKEVGSEIVLPQKNGSGYAYTPWQSESDGVIIADNKFTMPDNDVVITSVRTVLAFELTWELLGGTITSNEGSYTVGEITFGAQIVAPSVANGAKVFRGWTLDGKSVVNEFSTMPAKNLTYYALWDIQPYTITYKRFGATFGEVGSEGTIYATEAFIPGAPITEKPAPAPITGYNFGGWSWKKAGTGDVISEPPSTMPEYNIVVEGTYTPIMYNVTFNGNGLDINNLSQEVAYNALVAKPSDPSLAGFNFEGWYKEKECINEWNFETDRIEGETTLYAKWTMILTITAYDGIFDNESHNITVTGPTGSTVSYSDTQSGPYNDSYGKKDVGNYTVYYKVSFANLPDTIGSSTITVSPVVQVSLPPGVTLNCEVGNTGAENCNAEKNGIIHKYGVETTLPEAAMDGWNFDGWFSDSAEFETGVTSIAANQTDSVKLYPKFTKEITVTLSEEPSTIDVLIDNNDTPDSVSKKVNEAYNNLNPKPENPTKESSDKYDYTFKEFVCEENLPTYTCEAVFDSTGRTFTVAVNLPEGASLKCEEGDTGVENCTDAKDGIKHQYGVETTPLPDATMEEWDFIGWKDQKNGKGNDVTSIADSLYGENIKVYPYFTKDVEIVLSEDPEVKVEITLDLDDTPESVSNKVNEAFDKLEEPATPTKAPSDTMEYTFKEYVCEGSLPTYTCEAVFDSTGRTFTVAVNLPEGASLKCEEGDTGVENCTDAKDGIKHKYGVETTPLPDAAMEGWDFIGWFDDEFGKGNSVTSIAKELHGDEIEIYPYFTKDVEIVLSEDPEVKVEITLDLDDTPDSVSNKVNEAFDKLEESATPTKASSDTMEYTFKEFVCEGSLPTYTCEAVFDSTGRTFIVAVNLPEGANLKCEEGDTGVENCTATKDGIKHQYGVETTPLPDASMEEWDFIGWYENPIGEGEKLTSIAPNLYGDEIEIFPYFTKTIKAFVGDSIVEVVIDLDDTKDSIDAKIKAEIENRDPSIPTPEKAKDAKYEYEFAGYECNSNFVCVAVFDSAAYDIEVVVQYGNEDKDSIHVIVLSDDSESVIEDKIMNAFKEHDPSLPIPEKTSDPMYSYEFEKFVMNSQTGIYEPTFVATPRIYKITFHMPEEAKLLKEIEGNVYGETIILPNAVIESSSWDFKGWFTEENGNGSRVKVVDAKDLGEKEYFALFQKTIKYELNEKVQYLEIMYTTDSSKAIAIALNGVIPKDFKKNGKTYSFSKWELKKGVYVAKFTDITSIAQVRVPHFNVISIGRTLEITGAKKGSKIAVFDLGGRLVQSGIVEHGTQLLELQKPGSYIVRVNNQVRQVNVR